MQAWLDDHLFHGAKFSALAGPGKPAIWINASDIYNNTPFVFDPEDFAPLCSDLSKLPLSEGVAASAAVPIAFAPIVMQSFPKACVYVPPAWATAALADPNAPQNLRAYAQALLNYNNPAAMNYVKLLDGGLVDNFGLAALTLRRQEADPKTIAPMSVEQAVHLRRLMFVVVDAGQSTDNSWVKTVTGPTGPVIAMAAADTALNVAKLQSYDLFHDEMEHWQKRIVAWRCALSREDVVRLRGSDAGWDCRDLHFYVARVSFSLLDRATADALSVMPTTLSLPATSVDLLIKGGGDALMRAPEFQDFLRAGEKKVSDLQPASSSAGLPRG
jgi:NTE family protein